MTRVYGQSDDLIEFDGDVYGEVGCYGTDERERGALCIFSDGTLLEVKYCGRVPGVWELKCLRAGDLFDRIDVCTDEEADPYSDVAHFRDGLKYAYACTEEWERVS